MFETKTLEGSCDNGNDAAADAMTRHILQSTQSSRRRLGLQGNREGFD